MIETYKYVDDKVIAYDDKKGLVEYAYQDNINEIIEKENTIETLNNDYDRLVKVLARYKKSAKSFFAMLMNDNRGSKVVALTFLGLFIGVLGMNPVVPVQTVLGIISVISLVSAIPASIYSYIKYRKEMSIRVQNLENQLKDMLIDIQNEMNILDELKKDKTAIKNLNNIIEDPVYVDNNKIDSLKDYKKKQGLYTFFRTFISKLDSDYNVDYLKKLWKKDVSEEDLKFIDDMNQKERALYKENKKKQGK